MMSDRLQSERGMTLPEVLVTLTIALIVSLATFALIDTTMRQSGEISARVDAVQRGRSAMDTMTRQLRSQICLGVSPPRAIVEAAPTSVTFYGFMGDPSTKAAQVSATATPTPIIAEKRQLSLENGVLLERRWRGAPDPAVALGYTFPPAPTATRQLLEPVERVKQVDGTYAPLFAYFAYDATGEPKAPLAADQTLTELQMRKVALIRINYRALPAVRRPDGRASTELIDDVMSRTLNPNDTDKLTPCS